MSLNVLAIWPKHKIEMQIIYVRWQESTSLGVRVSGPDTLEDGAQGNIVMGLLL